MAPEYVLVPHAMVGAALDTTLHSFSYEYMVNAALAVCVVHSHSHEERLQPGRPDEALPASTRQGSLLSYA